MFNNSYSNPYYTGYMPTYMNYGTQQMQNRPIQQTMAQPVQQPVQPQPQQDLALREFRYGTFDEAKSHIVGPMGYAIFVDRAKNEIYIKTANQMGEPALETLKYTKTEKYSSQPVSPEFDPKELVKTGDLKNFITFEELESKSFATKQDLAGISKQLEQLQKKIDLTQILKGENNGK